MADRGLNTLANIAMARHLLYVQPLRPSSPRAQTSPGVLQSPSNDQRTALYNVLLGFQNAKERTYEVGSSLYRRTY